MKKKKSSDKDPCNQSVYRNPILKGEFEKSLDRSLIPGLTGFLFN